MKNIDTILNEFLDEQKIRLKERTYKEYESVIELFEIYLNDYAYQYVSSDKYDNWEKEQEEKGISFTAHIKVDELSESMISDFLDYFMIRKVMASETYIKTAVRVMKKFAKWLKEQNYRDDHLQDYFDEAKELPKVEKLAELIFDHSQHAPAFEYEPILDSSFIISEIEIGKLWLEDDFGGGEEVIGPVIVTNKISNLAQVGWRLNLVIGKATDGWHILESGNAYRF